MRRAWRADVGGHFTQAGTHRQVLPLATGLCLRLACPERAQAAATGGGPKGRAGNQSRGGDGAGRDHVSEEKHRKFKASLEGHASALQGLARGRYLPDDAEDLVQETIRCALENAYKLIDFDERQVAAWLATTMHRRFIDLYRRRKTEEHAQKGLEYLDEQTISLRGRKLEAWKQVSEEQYVKALRGLPANARYAFKLKAAGLKNTEIAVKLNVPYNTVGTLLFRARRYLKQRLVGASPPPDDYDENP